MRALVVYESMYGNTRAIAEGIAEGLRRSAEVRVVPVAEASDELTEWADMLVVGGPTHGHGMSTHQSRASARDGAAKAGAKLTLDKDAWAGVREWLEHIDAGHGKAAAAFDTRIKAPAILTGRAASVIGKLLSEHGYKVGKSESFLVDIHSQLVEGELDRAREWGSELVGGLVAVG